MKKFLPTIIAILYFVLAYLATAFIAVDLDFTNWSDYQRALFVPIGFGTSVTLFLAFDYYSKFYK